MTRPTIPLAPPPATPSPEATPTSAAPAVDRLAAAGIDPALTIDDWAKARNCSRREIERMRAAGKLPRPDFRVGRLPRWRAATVRDFVSRGCRQ